MLRSSAPASSGRECQRSGRGGVIPPRSGVRVRSLSGSRRGAPYGARAVSAWSGPPPDGDRPPAGRRSGPEPAEAGRAASVPATPAPAPLSDPHRVAAARRLLDEVSGPAAFDRLSALAARLVAA